MRNKEKATTSTAKTGNTTLVDGLVREFAGRISPDVVERAAAAARHVLERSRIPATRDTVERLTRDQLRARLSPRAGR